MAESKGSIEPNTLHVALEALGERVVNDFQVAFAHEYQFSCGCVRVYRISPITFRDSESLTPCRQHKWLPAQAQRVSTRPRRQRWQPR